MNIITQTQVKRSRELSAFFEKRDGAESRLRHLQEECAELIIESRFGNKVKVLEEAADVLIMLHSIFDIEYVYFPTASLDIECAKVIKMVNKHLRGLASVEDMRDYCVVLNSSLCYHIRGDVPIDRKLDRTAQYIANIGD